VRFSSGKKGGLVATGGVFRAIVGQKVKFWCFLINFGFLKVVYHIKV